ncbi:MAG: SurA N-terminal domain-containing protein [Actinomycetales bacterium]|nr:SurA N-terminal domain-containing protein [Actinomycetales bacterium]
MSRTAIRMLVGALLAVTVLAGCSVRPGAAAVVDGHVISQDELARTHTELGPLFQNPSPAQVLTVLIIEPAVVKAAEDNGVGVSADQARTQLATWAANAGLTDVPDYGPGTVAAARFQLASTALQNLSNASDVISAVTDEISKETVSVNPLYGAWDAKNAGVTALTFPWIAGSATK